jgi:beta-glucosidase
MTSTVTFPDGFLFGTATAAYQIEGAAAEDGRTPSIWDTFSRTPGKVMHGDTGDIACDHYHRLDADLDILSELGLGAYRFSIAWPRVLPGGGRTVNQKGLDFYRRVFDSLSARGIAPMVTLYHWDLPQELEDAGGWRNRDTAYRFAELASIIADAFAGDAAFWVTLNEPWCSAFVGHLEGRHAPGLESLPATLQAAHHLLLGHGLAQQALRGTVSGEIGVTLNLSDVHPATDSEADLRAASRIDGSENRWFLDPIFKGTYPADMEQWYSEHGAQAPVQDGDLDLIAAPIDFFGLNYYQLHHVVADDAEPYHAARILPPEPPVTDGDTPVRPEGLVNLLRRVSREYTDLPIYITENGAPYNDYITPENTVDDLERVDYLQKHFAAVADCIANDGLDVRGYFVWSLFDNFEWAEGYSRRFGIVFVEFGSQRRILKSSAKWYRELIALHKDSRVPAGS